MDITTYGQKLDSDPFMHLANKKDDGLNGGNSGKKILVY
jgi:hypothetical protein